MSELVIIGAGVAGLSLAKQLKARGVAVRGLEREAKLGGRLETGHHRVYTAEARDYLSDVLPGLEWVAIEEEPAQIKKGEWAPLTEELSDPERFYIGKPFWAPKATPTELLHRLGEEVGDAFLLRTLVTKVDLDRKVLVCLNGSEVAFSRLVWTGSLASLGKATTQTPRGLGKHKGTIAETGGITWDIRVAEPLFTQANTVAFPFRYKDLRIHALGVRAPHVTEPAETYHWMMFLEDALLENHEELAKIFRAFKRELTKQFPVLEKGILQEKLAFHASISGETPVPATSLEVFEGVVCVGPDIQTEEVSPDAGRHPRRNLDVTLRNCLDFLDLVLPRWQETPAPTKTATPPTEATVPAES